MKTEFTNFLKNYRFRSYRTITRTIPKKFLGIKYGTKEVSNTDIMVYNDFTIDEIHNNKVIISSGKNSSYRPEGYFDGTSISKENIRRRLEEIVNEFQLKYKSPNLSTEVENGRFSVIGFDN